MERIKRSFQVDTGIFGPQESVIEVPIARAGDLALELALLIKGMSESLTIRTGTGGTASLVPSDEVKRSRAIVTRKGSQEVAFHLGRNQLEYLQAVLLRAYRDQVAEVSHVHIEGYDNDAQHDLTIFFDLFRDGMTSAEAAKRLSE